MATTLTFTFLTLVLLLVAKASVDGRTATLGKEHVRGIIGAIIDYSSRIAKEQKVAMEMAIKDVFNKTNQRFDLHIKNTQSEPVQAALAGMLKKNSSTFFYPLSCTLNSNFKVLIHEKLSFYCEKKKKQYYNLPDPDIT